MFTEIVCAHRMATVVDRAFYWLADIVCGRRFFQNRAHDTCPGSRVVQRVTHVRRRITVLARVRFLWKRVMFFVLF